LETSKTSLTKKPDSEGQDELDDELLSESETSHDEEEALLSDHIQPQLAQMHDAEVKKTQLEADVIEEKEVELDLDEEDMERQEVNTRYKDHNSGLAKHKYLDQISVLKPK